MPLTEKQTEWVGKVSNTALKAEHFEKEQATRKAKLQELDSYYDSKFIDAMPELAEDMSPAIQNLTMKEVLTKGLSLQAAYESADGKKVSASTLEQGGSQIDEVDATEIDTADLLAMNSQDKLDLSMVAFSAMNGAKAILESGTVTDADGNDGKVFEQDDISEYMFQSLVRERALGETMVPDEYSQTHKMLDKTYSYYREDLVEFTEANKDKEADDAIHKALGTGSQLATITSNLVSALPIEQAKLASDIAKLTALSLDTLDSGREAVKKGDFRNASRGILDNVDKLASGILTLAMGKETGQLVGSLVTASLTGGKMAASMAQKPPDTAGAITALATGIESSFKFAAGSQDDPDKANQLAAIGAAAKAAILASPKLASLPGKIKDGDVAGVVDDMTAIAKAGLECSTKFKSADDKKNERAKLEAEGKSETEIKAAMGEIDKKAKKDLAKVTALVDLGNVSVKTTAVVVTAVKAKEIRSAADDIVAGVGGAFAGALKAAGVPSATITMLTASYKSISSAGLVATYMTATPPDKTKAFACVGNALGGALEAAAGDNADMVMAAKSVTLSFQAGATGVDIHLAIQNGKYDKAVKDLAGFADKAVATAFAIKVAGGTKKEAAAAAKKVKEISKGNKAAPKDITGKSSDHGGIDKVKSGALAFLQESEDKIRENVEAVAAKENEAEVAEIAEADAEVTAMLDAQNEVLDKIRQGGEADQSAAANSSIEKLVGDLQRDRMILDLAIKVSSGATALASQFVPALGTATAGIQLAASLIAAANRAMALNEWMKSQKDFKKAQSALSASAQSFVGQQKEQFSYYTIQAALDLAKVIGESLKCAGVTAAAGAVVSASADAGKSTQDLIRKFYKEAEMNRAWKITQKALQNPTNRRLGLEAQSMNPTLAKYAMAWAAVDNNDPLAKAAVRQCGLTDATLRNPETNVKNVQKYFEVYFKDDTQVRGVIEIQADWLPSNIELSLKSWSTVQSRAIKQGNLIKVSTGKIDRLLAEMAGQESKINVADDALDQGDLSDFLATLDQLESDFEDYKPMARNAKTHDSHKEVQGVVEIMLGKLSEKRSKANSRVKVAVVDLKAA